MDFYKQCANKLSALQPNETNENISNDQPDHETYFNRDMTEVMLDGL